MKWRSKSFRTRCLERDRKNRLGWAGDARLEIDDASNETDVAATPSRGRARVVPALAALVLGASIAWMVLGNNEAARDVFRFNVPVPEALDTFSALALSPDGKLLAYAGTREGVRQLFLRQLESGETTPVPGTEDARLPFFSPEGEWLGFSDDRNRVLRKIAVRGNQRAVTLGTSNSQIRSVSWGEDGFVYYQAAGSPEIYRVADSGGESEIAASTEGEGYLACPTVLPGGERLLVSRRPNGDAGVVDLQTGDWTSLIDNATCAAYISTGHIVFHRGAELYAAPFDVGRLRPSGEPVRVIENLMELSLWSQRSLSFSRSGHLVYAADIEGTVRRRLVRMDRTGRAETLRVPPGEYWSPSLSPDGKKIAMRIGNRDSDLWIYEWENDAMTRLTFDPADDITPVWTPDGEHVVFSSDRDAGRGNLYVIPSDGSGPARQLTDSKNLQWANSWSPDGKLLSITELIIGSAHDISMLPLDSATIMSSSIETPEPFITSSAYQESRPQFSPDGRFIAYRSNESGPLEIYVRAFPGPGGQWQVSNGGGHDALWSPRGDELFYLRGNKLMSVRYSIDGESFRHETPRELFGGTFIIDSFYRWFDVFPDGEHFLVMQAEGQNQLVFVVNWFDELKRLVPPNR